MIVTMISAKVRAQGTFRQRASLVLWCKLTADAQVGCIVAYYPDGVPKIGNLKRDQLMLSVRKAWNDRNTKGWKCIHGSPLIEGVVAAEQMLNGTFKEPTEDDPG